MNFIPHTEQEINEITDTITKKLISNKKWGNINLENKIRDITELKRVLFCDIDELPLLLNNKFKSVVKLRLEIGK